MGGMAGGIMDVLFNASTWIVPVLLAVTLHEVAHGYVANLLGDPTARLARRLSLNPLRHVDPVGTVVVPGLLFVTGAPFLFGWAKPVPVNFRLLRHPRRDMVLVALAGPGTNLLQAVIAAILLQTLYVAQPEATTSVVWAADMLQNLFVLNLVLAVFNMIPIPPLDGGRVAVGLLPMPLAMQLARLERVGMLLLIGVIFILPLLGAQLGFNFNVFSWVVGGPVNFLAQGIAFLVGG